MIVIVDEVHAVCAARSSLVHKEPPTPMTLLQARRRQHELEVERQIYADNPMLMRRNATETAEVEDALDVYLGTAEAKARAEVSRLHPDQGGPGGDEFKAAMQRLKEVKRADRA